ncbi:MAG TPA: hypothetical protein VFG12_17950 [Rhodopila sp.]|jgi:hypothetical protein|nr:hypothetical protein [Rhodopila sp.]
MMDHDIAPLVLGGLSTIFAVYGLWELARAYQATAWKDWSDRAVPGAGGVILAALFADLTLRILG